MLIREMRDQSSSATAEPALQLPEPGREPWALALRTREPSSLCLAVATDAWDGANMRRRQTCAMDEAGRYLAGHSVRSQTFAGGFTPASNSCPLRVR